MPSQKQLLQKLTLEQLEQALMSLYNEQEPLDQELLQLQQPEWEILGELLSGLLIEKQGSSLH
jgi:hypothetical protein